jgi:hypothetical protein
MLIRGPFINEFTLIFKVYLCFVYKEEITFKVVE